MRTEEYAPGRLIDIHGDGTAGIVLLWHGMTPEVRGLLAPLADTIAASGRCVLVPDWDSAAADLGRADLLGSVRYARETATALDLDPDGLFVVGWSLGGTAAISLAVHAKRLGLGLAGVVTLAAAFDAVDPLSGVPLPDPLPPGADQPPVMVLHGEDDDVVDPSVARDGCKRLAASGWQTTLVSTGTDHAGIVMTRHDPELGYVSSTDETRLLQGRAVVDALELLAATTS